MLIPNQSFNIRINASSIKHYQEKGYENLTINCFCDIKAEDFSIGAKSKILVQCDYCNKVFEKRYYKYKKQREHIEKDCCFDCFPLKQKEVLKKKYGEGGEAFEEHKRKQQIAYKETSLKNHGCENPMSSKFVQDKFKASMQFKYGCDYAQQNLEIKQKTEDTFVKNYGVKSSLSSLEIREKYRRNLKFANGIMVSGLQIAIANFLEGSMNVKISNFYIDILLKDNIIIEYNGGGHRLKVFFGKMTEEEFDLKEKERVKLLNSLGYKVIAINNAKNKKPIFKELLEKIVLLKQSDINYAEYNVS